MLTTECVTPKHPDKMCDRIVDRVLDQIRAVDPEARVALEMVAGHGLYSVVGEVRGIVTIQNVEALLREAIKDIAKDPAPMVNVKIVLQSPEIARGVDAGGAGDQGIMVGYACDENPEMVPQEHYLARSLCRFIYERHEVDGKTQITLGDNMEVTAIVASFQNVPAEEIATLVMEWADKNAVDISVAETHYNPAGDWSTGGFDADSGMNGRKVVVDAYGTRVAVGGGAFSGKDATKVDRSGAYLARNIACQLVAFDNTGVRDIAEATVKIAYAIGVAEPVDVFGNVVYKDGRTARITKTMLERYGVNMDFTPAGIAQRFDLKYDHEKGAKNLQFEKTAEWGAFGNGFAWDKVEV